MPGVLPGLVVALAMMSGPAMPQALLEEVTTLSSAATTVERTFTLPAGDYQVRLTDFGQPENFTSLRLIVTRGLEVVSTVDAPGTRPFTTTAGVHEIHVVGTPDAASGAGVFGVTVLRPDNVVAQCAFADSGGTQRDCAFADSIAVPPQPNPNVATFAVAFAVTEAGAYDVAVDDLTFPSAVDNVQFNILTPGGVAFPGPQIGEGTFTFVTAPGEHQLLLVVAANSTAAAALCAVRISGGPSGGVVYDRAHPVGEVAPPSAITLPTTGAYTFRLADFNAPVAFIRLQSIVMRGSAELARRDGPGDGSFNAQAGVAELFLLATPAVAPGSGTLGIHIATGSTTTYSDARTVNAASDVTEPGFTFAATLVSAGTYRLALNDFRFPTPLNSLAANIIQAGSVLNTLPAPNSVDFNAAAGPIFVTVIAGVQNASSGGLFGLQLAPASGGSALIGMTQGVGALFDARTVDVAQAGAYDITLGDLEFPGRFSELWVNVTRGADQLGSIVGEGTVSIQTTPGRYFLNFIARPNAQAGAGTYALRVSRTLAPTVTLAASPASVPNGSTTTLTWNSTNATACTASGAWSGSKATTGSQPSGALTSSSTFTLTCTGAGGNANQSVTVTIASPSSGGGGGGGSLGVPALCALLIILAVRRREARYA